ncbi:MAG: YciI family protein [Gammaproteobacteria bacterium]
MFIVTLTYLKPIEIVEQYLADHRNYLEEGYKKDYFIASGPKTPRTGGVIISQLTDRGLLESIIEKDPFFTNNIAKFDIIEFTPVKYHQNFKQFIEG